MKSIIWLFSGGILFSFYFYGFGAENEQVVNIEGIPCVEMKIAFHGKKNTSILPFDIIINEIMADPAPAVLLPEYEYVELFNRSFNIIDLNEWSLEVGSKKFKLSGLIEPDSFIILTYGPAAGYFLEYGAVNGIFTSSVALNNSGQLLILRDNNNEIIDAVFYEDKWYGDAFKMQGGWSIERIDPHNVCAGKDNWAASESLTGGTPGKKNSVYGINPDLKSPYITGIELITEKKILIKFNERIDRYFFEQLTPFLLTESINNIVGVTAVPPFYDSCILEFQNNLTEVETYQITAGERLQDCAGNKMKMPLNIRFGKPIKPGYTDIIITEVLVSPFPGCPEFIEIYNNTDNLLDLSGVIIGINYGNSGEVKREYVTNEMFLFYPREYLVISTDPVSLENYYEIKYPERLFQMKKIPSLRDPEGCIELTDRSLQLLDRYCYSLKDHYPLLNDYHGVSLERIHIDKSPGFLSRWHSASSTAGFATPGYLNSQHSVFKQNEKTLNTNIDFFTPDNDGKDDVVIISFYIPEEGYTGNIIILMLTAARPDICT